MSGFKLNGFNIGQDISVTLRKKGGDAFNVDQLGHLVDFEAQEEDTLIQVKPISHGGKVLNDRTPQGWSGKLSFARMDGTLTDMLAENQQKFYENGERAKYDIQVIVANRNGTTNTYLFSECILHKGTFGGFKADKEVDQGFSFNAQNMTKSK